MIIFNTACAIEILDLEPTVVRAAFLSSVQVATLASRAEFDPVGVVSIAGNTGSGTLINSVWVLTAAHVISGTGGRHNLASSAFVLKGNSYTVDYAEVFPTWAGDPGGGNDLALLHLAISNEADQPAFYLNQPVTLVNNEVTFVGYGLAGDGVSGSISDTGGVKRAGTNVLDFDGSVLGMSTSVYLADFDSGKAQDNVIGSSVPTSYESILAPGDSGGGLFMNVNGRTTLVGVNSFVASTTGTANSTYGNLAGFTAIQPNVAWIQSVTQVPEPGSLALGVICALIGWWAVEQKSSRTTQSKPGKQVKFRDR